MDVREKLFTLFQDCNNPSWKWFPNNAEMLKLIDYLIAHGVTVQEWYFVSECMPEDLAENNGKKVINCIVEHDPYGNGKKSAQFRQRKYDKYSDKWYWSKIGGCTVIRWTMMPQPPKGE